MKITKERCNYGHEGPFWYFTTHGVQPGSIPKGVHVLEIRDGRNDKGTMGTFVALDGVLTTDELKCYDMKEMSPKINEGFEVTPQLVRELVDEYRSEAHGFNGVKDYVETQYPRHPEEFKKELIKKIKKAMNESLKEDTNIIKVLPARIYRQKLLSEFEKRLGYTPDNSVFSTIREWDEYHKKYGWTPRQYAEWEEPVEELRGYVEELIYAYEDILEHWDDINESLKEDVSTKPDFLVGVYELDDETLDEIRKVGDIGVSMDEIFEGRDERWKNGFKKWMDETTIEDIEDDEHGHSIVGEYIFKVAKKKVPSNRYRPLGLRGIKVVNEDVLASWVNKMSKYLGKKLLPPRGQYGEYGHEYKEEWLDTTDALKKCKPNEILDALQYFYGEDIVKSLKDIEKYTNEEKLKALKYYFKKHPERESFMGESVIKPRFTRVEKWTDILDRGVYSRLAHCQSRKSDIEKLVNAKWSFMKQQGKDKKGFTKEDALVSVLELLDDNGQYIDLTREEYNELCEEYRNFKRRTR